MCYIIFNISNCASASETFSTVTTGVDMILCTATVIGTTCSDFRRHIRIGNNSYGNISLTNDRAVNSHFSHELSYLAYHNGSGCSGYYYKIKSENIAFEIVDLYKIRCLKSDSSRVFIVFITGLIS
jgi:hypothetical protein